VFAEQNLVPTYSVGRVRSLVRNMEPTGNVLLIRARDAKESAIATRIYPGLNQIAEFWGNASFRAYQNLRPNEACTGTPYRYWKKRGATIFDWGGEGTYKEKYGCHGLSVPWFIKSRYESWERFAMRLATCLTGSKSFWDGCRGIEPVQSGLRKSRNLW